MAKTALSPTPLERRKEQRHDVQLIGRLRCGGITFALEVGDLSSLGALILLKGAPPVGTIAELWIEDYGPIVIKVMHAGAYFCGVEFVEPAAHRTQLLKWLGEDVGDLRACGVR